MIDASDPRWEENEQVVQQVLNDIGAGEIPIVRVFNKIDKPMDDKYAFQNELTDSTVCISAKMGTGLEALSQAIATQLQGVIVEEIMSLGPQDGKLRATLYQLGVVVHEEPLDEGGWKIIAKLTSQQKTSLSDEN